MTLDAFAFIVINLLLMVSSWVFYRRSPIRRLYAATIFISFTYWYILPGTIFLMGMSAGGRDLNLLQEDKAVISAMVIVWITIALLILLPSLFSCNRTIRSDMSPNISQKLRLLVIVSLLGSIISFFISFQELGLTGMLVIILLESSARDVLSFENQSSGAYQSLTALLQIIVTFFTLFCITLLTMRRQVNSMNFLYSFGALVIIFISTGSRSILIMPIFAMMLVLIYKLGQQERKTYWQYLKPTRLLIMGLNLFMVLFAVAGIIARFSNNKSELEQLLLSSISSHNDMFRELIFVTANHNNYFSSIGTFLLTPFTFAMPSFLGFNKSIPVHLVDFNRKRANIDLIYGEGNVFPGLLGDAYMLTGFFAPFLIAMVTFAILAAFHRSTLAKMGDQVQVSLLISLLCYFFISVRNLQGSLLIIVLLAICLRIIFKTRVNV